MVKHIMTSLLMLIALDTYANIANNILLSRSPEQKTQILSNIINAAGEPCLGIASFYQGMDTYGQAYWNVACSESQSYVVLISNDQEAKTTIIQCSAMKSLGAECFKRFGF